MTICILGRQPEFGLAELESLYGFGAVSRLDSGVALVKAEVDLSRLGGCVKTARVLTVLDMTHWNDLVNYCAKELPKHVCCLPAGKLKFGLSLYGFNETPASINKAGLKLKKVIKNSGRSVRVVPNTEAALSSAQTYHNQLTSQLGMELVFVKAGNKTYLAQVSQVQNINDYRQRDRERPKRDARVGMLPPKLAQILINLSGFSKSELSQLTILDPFCGTGVVLQEAALLGFSIYGTDIEQRMIDYSKQNLAWLQNVYELRFSSKLEVGDATDYKWQPPIDAVVSETYLGRPFTAQPSPEILSDTIAGCNLIIKKFLKNIQPQLKPGTRLCLAVPAWQTEPGQFRQLPLIDQLRDLGYNRVEFKHVLDEQLLYFREGQIVARKLLVIVRK